MMTKYFQTRPICTELDLLRVKVWPVARRLQMNWDYGGCLECRGIKNWGYEMICMKTWWYEPAKSDDY